ncbi:MULTISPECIES: Cas10/Cmr2 second palm domain-containing protein [unclassified Agarivorans]|uniref:Cas10/Cmr2 second palm domain-containing protein n=1 Tax=unclassified Agarivorans TaxID=2636026 RepID=UPI003D7E4203
MYVVKLEFKRIQTFLFSSFRFKHMVGANALLGNVLRAELVTLVNNQNDSFYQPISPPSLNKLDEDPLDKATAEFYADKPDELWKIGVLSRDGGHFYAVFSGQKLAEQFLFDAEQLIQQKLPGVQVSFTLSTIEQLDSGKDEHLKQGDFSADEFPNLPIFQPCQFSEQGIAEAQLKHLDKGKQFQSNASSLKSSFIWEQFKDSKGKLVSKEPTEQSADVASILMRQWTGNEPQRQAKDLDELVGKDYLALIVADGNSMGNRFSTWLKDQNANTWLDKQAKAEEFFYSARKAMRTATHEAVKNQFDWDLNSNAKATLPFQLLMLGGDDLLFACRAKDALPFITKLDYELSQIKLDDGKPMQLGVGVVIASHNLPFYRLHHVAEELASSAKVLARAYEDSTPCSVLDWQVVTQSWAGDPIEERQKNAIVKYQAEKPETLYLTQKPYTLSRFNTLLGHSEGLVKEIKRSANNKADAEQKGQVARSQLRYLQQELGKGRLHAERIWQGLPTTLRNHLKNECEITQLWQQLEEEHYISGISDLVELFEISNLSRADEAVKESAK